MTVADRAALGNTLTVFVNTSDGFADCWDPFFRLFDTYAGILRTLPVYLNTERLNYEWRGLSLTATAVWERSETQRPTWSECLARGLAKTPTPYVLYLHEDYFLTRPVDDAAVVAAVELLDRDPAIGVVYLNRYGPQFHRHEPCSGGFVRILPPARYLVSAQAAIWRKDFLQGLIRPWENAWMFEKFASQRVQRGNRKLVSVAPRTMATTPVIDYVYTGVIKGQWQAECVALFDQHGIRLDFEKRGFYRDRGRLKSRVEVLARLMEHPARTFRSLLSLLHP